MSRPRVAFLVPVYNGGATLAAALDAILGQRSSAVDVRVVAVDDGSTDDSPEVLRSFADSGSVAVLDGRGEGAAAAINLGLEHIREPVVCQVDQDVELAAGWLDAVLDGLRDPAVAAVQGILAPPAHSSVWARVAGYDVALRQTAVAGGDSDHVCTGNTAYRRAALASVGGLDETLGYGYDNDLSYRLLDAGHRLVISPRARAVHHWPADVCGFLRQQYGQGYGRLDVVAKHRRRISGDRVSGAAMLLHVPVTLAALAASGFATAAAARGRAWQSPATIAAALVAGLAVERVPAAVRAGLRFHDPAGLLMVPIHLLRDLAWAAAAASWSADRLTRRRPSPSRSMSRGRP